jgi:hypothetical protein
LKLVLEAMSWVTSHLNSIEVQGLKPRFLRPLNVAAEAATHKTIWEIGCIDMDDRRKLFRDQFSARVPRGFKYKEHCVLSSLPGPEVIIDTIAS